MMTLNFFASNSQMIRLRDVSPQFMRSWGLNPELTFEASPLPAEPYLQSVTGIIMALEETE